MTAAYELKLRKAIDDERARIAEQIDRVGTTARTTRDSRVHPLRELISGPTQGRPTHTTPQPPAPATTAGNNMATKPGATPPATGTPTAPTEPCALRLTAEAPHGGPSSHTQRGGVSARASRARLVSLCVLGQSSSQEPLKQQYRDDPSAAMITLSAEGRLGEGVTCSVATGRAIARAGLHPASGGDGFSLCSGDMLLEALAACAGVTLGAVATSLDIPIRGGSVRVEGDLDFRGTLAVSKEARVGFTAIRVSFDLDTDATDDQLDTLLQLTERYCVVMQTLTSAPSMTFGTSSP